MNEESLTYGVKLNPKDPVARNVYADWLDDQADPRADYVRGIAEDEQQYLYHMKRNTDDIALYLGYADFLERRNQGADRKQSALIRLQCIESALAEGPEKRHMQTQLAAALNDGELYARLRSFYSPIFTDGASRYLLNLGKPERFKKGFLSSIEIEMSGPFAATLNALIPPVEEIQFIISPHPAEIQALDRPDIRSVVFKSSFFRSGAYAGAGQRGLRAAIEHPGFAAVQNLRIVQMFSSRGGLTGDKILDGDMATLLTSPAIRMKDLHRLTLQNFVTMEDAALRILIDSEHYRKTIIDVVYWITMFGEFAVEGEGHITVSRDTWKALIKHNQDAAKERGITYEPPKWMVQSTKSWLNRITFGALGNGLNREHPGDPPGISGMSRF